MSVVKKFSSIRQSYRNKSVQMSSIKDMDLLEGAEEELAASTPQKRNWKGILTAFGMIIFLSGIIVAAIFFLTPLDANADELKKPLSLKDAVSSNILGHIESMEWLDSGKLLIKANEMAEVFDFDTEPRQNWTLFDMETLYRHGKVKSTNVIPGTPYIEVTYTNDKNKKTIYETYTIKRFFNTKTKTFEHVGPEKTGTENVGAIRYAPKGEGYLTHDGNTDYRHGHTSWGYQEEIFGPEAFWWSPDGNELVYLTTNLSAIETYDISWYGGKQYPDQQTMRYAKTGVRNLEQIQLRVWQKVTRQTLNFTVDLPENMRVYLMSAKFVRFYDENVFIAVFANRFQDEITFTMCTLRNAKCVPSYHHSYEIGDMHQYASAEILALTVYTDNAFFAVLPHRRPNGDVFEQIARIQVPRDFRNAQESFLAMGDQVVDKIHSYDPVNDLIFFTSPFPIHRQLHLYSTPAKAQPNVYHAHCVTCNISSNCTYHDSTFAPDSTKFFMNCKGIGPTTIFVAEAQANNTLKVHVEFGQTSERERELVNKKFPKVYFENITLSNGFVSYVRLFLPHGVTLETAHKKYPVLVYIYAGPNSHAVHEEWLPEMPVDVYFASTLEYIIVNIDGRGSGNAGWRRRQAMYGHLGTVEIDDQIETTRLLLDKHKFMDRKRVGVWGWSYGGFASAHIVARDNLHTFKCAAIIAPVIYFKMYDAIYTERYMGNASEHDYDLTNVARNVSNFHYAQTLLVHGTGDDNVHFQNAVELISAFVRENVHFNLMVYPDERHSLKGVRHHLFETLISFFRNCMDHPPTAPEPPPHKDAKYVL
ncbi:hypothetical protein M3Y97_00454800 [Aphelenchoides bicaudatus]|nr:hypothetical protein M3Y97_00454800 [Aphelenchoides bicaudatus]